uniref:NAD(P)/FAD-dependent oxidoreductase n=1 Tax=Algoriphagus sp. TaxID=1872435 RepID=UPI004047BFB2
MSEKKIYIVGAGLSGLIAALELEKAGLSAVILEASDRIGGRMKTDVEAGYRFDHGFQVLNTAYPEAKRYLDFQALQLKNFDPGAIIFEGKDSYILTDPLRNPLKLVGMAVSRVGTFLDKVRVFTLTQELKKKSPETIFSEPSLPTHEYLKNYGFSDAIITNFFRPFFRGIFLEKDLETSSRMFEFVFKMFSQGYAAVPAKGMGQIPEMIKSQLQTTEIKLNTPVASVEGENILLSDGTKIKADRIIVAVQPDLVMKQLEGQFAPARKVINLYFAAPKSFLGRPMIGLLTGKRVINNFVFMEDVSKEYAPIGKSLLSVTVLESTLAEKELIKVIQSELEELSGMKAEHFKHLKTYFISYALPQVGDLKFSIPFTECKVLDQVFLAGDYLLHGSINAAMTSGRVAAEAVIHSFREREY